MTPLPITVTRAGLARITAAQLGAPVDFTVAAVALSDAPFVPAPTLEAVPGEFRRLSTVSGAKEGDNTLVDALAPAARAAKDATGSVDEVVTEQRLQGLYGIDFEITRGARGRLCNYFNPPGAQP